jgi:hypothetical protein
VWLAVGAVGAVSGASVRVGEGGGERGKRRDRDTRVRVVCLWWWWWWRRWLVQQWGGAYVVRASSFEFNTIDNHLQLEPPPLQTKACTMKGCAMKVGYVQGHGYLEGLIP